MPQFNQLTAGQFCRELATGIEPLADLLDSWGLTPERYQELRTVEWFQRELIQAVSDVKDLGPNSAYIMKCRCIAEETLPNMLEIIQDGKVDAGVRASVYKQITELGRLNAPKTEAQQSQGPSVVFNFGGKLKGIPESLEVYVEPQPQIEEPIAKPVLFGNTQVVPANSQHIINIDLESTNG